MAMDGYKSFSGNDLLIQEQCKGLCEQLKSTVTALVLSETANDNKQVKNLQCSCDNKVAAWSQLSRYLIIMLLFSVLMFGYLFPFPV